MKEPLFLPLLLALALPVAAQAAAVHGHAHMPASHGEMAAAEHAAISGQPGDADEVSRTVEILLNDDMRFTPASIDVKEGETIRFVVRNNGQVDHEMVLGQLDDLKAHAEAMQSNPGMAHKEPNQVYLEPGQRGSMVWQFTKAGTVDFACTVPGHLEAGMVGKVHVTP